MKSYQRPILSSRKTGSLSRADAREAAELIRDHSGVSRNGGDSNARGSSLWERYLGHFGSGLGHSSRKKSSTRKKSAGRKSSARKMSSRKTGGRKSGRKVSGRKRR